MGEREIAAVMRLTSAIQDRIARPDEKLEMVGAGRTSGVIRDPDSCSCRRIRRISSSSCRSRSPAVWDRARDETSTGAPLSRSS